MKTLIDKKLESFTLLEITIAVALFAAITLSILGIFSKIIQTQYEIYDMQTLQNDAQYFTEVLSKETRMAKKDEDGACVEVAGRVFYAATLGSISHFKFLNYRGECIYYRFDPASQKIYKRIDGSDPISITSNDVYVESAQFIRLDDMTSGVQPIASFRATFSNPNYSDESKKIKIQTTISARVYQ